MKDKFIKYLTEQLCLDISGWEQKEKHIREAIECFEEINGITIKFIDSRSDEQWIKFFNDMRRIHEGDNI